MNDLLMCQSLHNVPLWIDGLGAIADRATGRAYTATATTLGEKVKNGGEIIFNGETSKIVCGAVGNVYSMCFWIKTMYEPPTQSILDLDGTTTVDILDGTVRANNWTNAVVSVNNTVSESLTLGAWNFIAITSDTAVNAAAVVIGLISTSYFDGSLCNIRFFNKQLSAADIGRLSASSLAGDYVNVFDDDDALIYTDDAPLYDDSDAATYDDDDAALYGDEQLLYI